MAKRKNLSKSIRFEVFKRDKFTCQYCGKKAPEVLLQVDHIDPVARGGTNEIVNLITSCFDCNSGKSDRKIDDDSTLQKQRNQLELLQEKREQMRFMMEWRKSLTDIEGDIVNEVAEYIKYFIGPSTINNKGKLSLRKLVKKYKLDDILDAIDTSATTYLKYDKDGELQEDSIEVFLNKIGGILFTRNMTPLQQKLVYIKGIVKNKFGKDDKTAISILLNNYVGALEKQGYSDEKILSDLENELTPKIMELSSWNNWRNLMEGWTRSIQNWDKIETNATEESENDKVKPRTDEELRSFVSFELGEIDGYERAIIYMGKIFPRFDETSFLKKLREQYLLFLSEIESMPETEMSQYKEKEAMEDFISKYLQHEDLHHAFSFYDDEKADFFLLGSLEPCIDDLLYKAFSEMFHPYERMQYANILRITQMLKEEISVRGGGERLLKNDALLK